MLDRDPNHRTIKTPRKTPQPYVPSKTWLPLLLLLLRRPASSFPLSRQRTHAPSFARYTRPSQAKPPSARPPLPACAGYWDWTIEGLGRCVDWVVLLVCMWWASIDRRRRALSRSLTHHRRQPLAPSPANAEEGAGAWTCPPNRPKCVAIDQFTDPIDQCAGGLERWHASPNRSILPRY